MVNGGPAFLKQQRVGRSFQVNNDGVASLAEQGLAADCLQRPLRSRFRQQLKAGVAMTSDVKRWQQIFLGFHDLFVLGASEKPEPGRSDG
jgi:hypothetical protein